MDEFQLVVLLLVSTSSVLSLPTYRHHPSLDYIYSQMGDEAKLIDTIIETRDKAILGSVVHRGSNTGGALIIIEDLSRTAQSRDSVEVKPTNEKNSLRMFLRSQIQPQLRPFQKVEQEYEFPAVQSVNEPTVHRLDAMGSYEKILESFISRIMSTVLQAEIQEVRVEEMDHTRRKKDVSH